MFMMSSRLKHGATPAVSNTRYASFLKDCVLLNQFGDFRAAGGEMLRVSSPFKCDAVNTPSGEPIEPIDPRSDAEQTLQSRHSVAVVSSPRFC